MASLVVAAQAVLRALQAWLKFAVAATSREPTVLAHHHTLVWSCHDLAAIDVDDLDSDSMSAGDVSAVKRGTAAVAHAWRCLTAFSRRVPSAVVAMQRQWHAALLSGACSWLGDGPVAASLAPNTSATSPAQSATGRGSAHDNESYPALRALCRPVGVVTGLGVLSEFATLAEAPLVMHRAALLSRHLMSNKGALGPLWDFESRLPVLVFFHTVTAFVTPTQRGATATALLQALYAFMAPVAHTDVANDALLCSSVCTAFAAHTATDGRVQETLSTLLAPCVAAVRALQRLCAESSVSSESHDVITARVRCLGNAWYRVGAWRVHLLYPQSAVDPACKTALRLVLTQQALASVDVDVDARAVHERLVYGSDDHNGQLIALRRHADRLRATATRLSGSAMQRHGVDDADSDDTRVSYTQLREELQGFVHSMASVEKLQVRYRLRCCGGVKRGPWACMQGSRG